MICTVTSLEVFLFGAKVQIIDMFTLIFLASSLDPCSTKITVTGRDPQDARCKGVFPYKIPYASINAGKEKKLIEKGQEKLSWLIVSYVFVFINKIKT